MRAQLEKAVGDDAWLGAALARLNTEPGAIRDLFPAVGRCCGRGRVDALSGWSVEDAARALLLTARPVSESDVIYLYRYGDPAEKCAILRTLPLLEFTIVDLLCDAIRTNDPRLLAAALGPCAAALDAPTWRQAVIKCLFVGVPLSCVHDLALRTDLELARMVADFVMERRAAGRAVPSDVWLILERE
jgi:hypothetical protein